MADYQNPYIDPFPGATTSAIDARRRYALGIMQQAGDGSPTKANAIGAIARALQGAAGGYMAGQADQSDAADKAQSQSLVERLIGGGSLPQASNSPVTSAPIQAADASMPRGLRNNNPLNIEAGGFTQGQPGYSGSDGRFAQFQTPQQGLQAANTLLDTYQNKYGLNTPAGIVGRWAPRSDGNNVSAYASDVAQKLGIGPNDTIPPQMRQQLIAAMAQHENGKPLPSTMLAGPVPTPDSAPPQQVAQNAPQGAQSGDPNRAALVAQLLATRSGAPIGTALAGKLIDQQIALPEFKTLTDITGAQRPVWVRASDQSVKPANVGGVAGGPSNPAAAGDPEQVAAAYEKDYPGVNNRVEQLYRGEGSMLNKRQRPLDAAADQLIAIKHPDWNQNVWSDKNKMWTGLGNMAQNALGGRIQSGQNAFDHLANTADGVVQMKNAEAGGLSPVSGTINAITNALSNTQKGVINKIENEAATYGGERTKFLTGAEGTYEDRTRLFKTLSPTSSSPVAMAGALEGEYTQLKAAVERQENDLVTALGPEAIKRHPVVTPKTKEFMQRIETAIAKLRGNAPPDGAGPAQGQAQAAPIAGSKTLAPADQQALEWANSNASDPRAAQIKSRLGVQ